MKLYQRACYVLAREGVSGLYRRGLRKVLGPEADRRPPLELAQAAYARIVREFQEQTRRRGCEEECRRYYWYHTVDLGAGLVTPGDYDFRDVLPAFHFPEDMSGMTVLDVGSATGFFAFEFERRGARVVSVELPSLTDWDMTSAEREQTLRGFLEAHQVQSLEEAHHNHLDGPFAFCRRLLQSRVERCYSRIYDLTPEKLGVDGFDLVFVGDVLVHTFSPFQALDRLASLCRGTLVISHDAAEWDDERPLMMYLGGDGPGDNRSWWLLSPVCLEQMLRKLGFRTVQTVGRHEGIIRRAWQHYDRVIVHATR